MGRKGKKKNTENAGGKASGEQKPQSSREQTSGAGDGASESPQQAPQSHGHGDQTAAKEQQQQGPQQSQQQQQQRPQQAPQQYQQQQRPQQYQQQPFRERTPQPHYRQPPRQQQYRQPGPQQQYRQPAPQQQYRQPAPQQQYRQPGLQQQYRQPAPQQQYRQPGPQQQYRQPAPQQQQYRQPTPQPQPQQEPLKGQATQQPTQRPAGPTGTASAVARVQRSNAGDTNIVAKMRFQPGTKGRVIKVQSNHVDLNLGNIRIVYHYDVEIVPDTPKRMLRPVMEIWRKKNFPSRYPAFDGRKNLYTSTPLTNNLNDIIETELEISVDERLKTYKVTVKFANEVDLTPLRDLVNNPVTPQEALQVVDIVLRMAPAQRCYPVGRSFFLKPRDHIIDLGEGMEMYNGFYQSAIRGWKPLLNVDVAHKAFPRNINVVEAMASVLSGREVIRPQDLKDLQRWQGEIFEKYMRTLRVSCEIPGIPNSKKTYRVNGLGAPAAVAAFENNGRRITVEAYYLQEKRYKIRYPQLPTLWVGSTQRKDKVLVPAELCTILEGQGVNRKMTENQTSKMIREAATDTNRRKEKIMNGLREANYNQDPTIREFGFSVGNEFQNLDARVLQPPDLQYRSRVVRVSKGQWRNDVFLEPVTVGKWTVAHACQRAPRPDDFHKLVDMIMKCGRDVGMVFTAPATQPFGNMGPRYNYANIEQYFRSIKNQNFDVIFVVVPDFGQQYSYVKKAAEVDVGCLTQCLKSGTLMRRLNPQTVTNILLKVNSKLNGKNHTFAPQCKPNILKRPVIIMGADVTHPGPDSVNVPSVAAVTASHDPKAFQYNITWRLQKPTVEIIEDLEAITIEHLRYFNQKTNVKPEAIVFFRDGVSEGQFEIVREAEIRAIRSACKKLQSDGYEPKITFLVVQKRHHTRLFPVNVRDSEDRNFNVPAGTCVDTTITHPFLQDFYLVSHASIQGVAKPTKYVTLWDDNDMSNDQVEELAYYLCHMFTRCNRSVSYPAPTYYAHLAAARAKVYILDNDRLDLDRLRDEFKKLEIKEEIRKAKPMFFV